MHEFWTIPIVDMMYTKSQNYTNMVIDNTWNTNIQSCDSCGFCVVVIWCLMVLSPQVHIPY